MEGLNNKFEKLIYKLQELRKEHGFEYEEKCEAEIEMVGSVIKDKGLIDMCDDKHFAKQLCMVNCIPEKYWN